MLGAQEAWRPAAHEHVIQTFRILLMHRAGSPAIDAGDRVMLYAVLTLFALQFLGDVIAAMLSLPIPGMVIGLMLLLLGFGLRGSLLGRERAVPDAFERVAKSLHDHLGLLFVPAGAGIVANLSLVASDGAMLLVTILLSTVTTVALTGLIAVGQPQAAHPLHTAAAE
jgi:holin-like protein